MRQLYIYDDNDIYGGQAIKPSQGLMDFILKYDFSYLNSGGFENIVYLNLGEINDIIVYVQYNVVSKKYRTILIYDDNKYDLRNYIIPLAKNIQYELKKFYPLNKSSTYDDDYLEYFYTKQLKLNQKHMKIQQLYYENTGNYIDGNKLFDLDILLDQRKYAYYELYKAEMKIKSIESTINKYGLDAKKLSKPDISEYVKGNEKNEYNISSVNSKIDFKTNFDVEGLSGNGMHHTKQYRDLYPNMLRNLNLNINGFVRNSFKKLHDEY